MGITMPFNNSTKRHISLQIQNNEANTKDHTYATGSQQEVRYTSNR